MMSRTAAMWAMVFQNYALYPHMSVAQNIASLGYGCKADPNTIRERVEARSSLLTTFLIAKPGNYRAATAGGIGQAIARQPKVFYLMNLCRI